MKFTSEDLLKAMGLKAGDRVKLDRFNEELEIMCTKNGEFILKEKNQIFNDTWIISNLMDCEVTILQPKPTLTEDEKVILRNLPKDYKWIARDKDGKLFTYKTKPEKMILDGVYAYEDEVDEDYLTLKPIAHLFKLVKWEDEPYSIEELLKE